MQIMESSEKGFQLLKNYNNGDQVYWTFTLLSYFPTFLISYFSTFLLSYFPTFLFSTFLLSYFHTSLLSYFSTSLFPTSLLTYLPIYLLTYLPSFLLIHHKRNVGCPWYSYSQTLTMTTTTKTDNRVFLHSRSVIGASLWDGLIHWNGNFMRSNKQLNPLL